MAFTTELYSSATAYESYLKDVISNKSHMYLLFNETGDFFSVSKTYTLATTLFAGFSGLVADALIGGYLGVQVGSEYYLCPITDNTATDIEIDPTDTMCEYDISTDLVTATAYNVKVFANERFLGETFGVVQTPNITKKDFKHGYPERTGFEEMTGVDPMYNFNIKTTGRSLDKYLFRLTPPTNAVNTTYTHEAHGPDSSTLDYFLVIFKDRKNKAGKEARIVLLNASLWLQGDKPEDADKDGFVEVGLSLHAVNEALAPQDGSLARRMYEV